LVLAASLLLAHTSSGCSSSSDGSNAGSGGSGGSGGKATAGTGGKATAGAGAAGMCPSNAGGPVTSPDGPDKHCTGSSGELKQATNESACKPPADAGEPSGNDDAGTQEQAPILYGSEADDDDCKYHLKWTASCIAQNRDVTFNLTVTKKADGTPLTKAPPDLEVYLSDTHPAPNTNQKPVETAPGVYTAGPIKFDASGKWIVRFHLREECVDLTPDSPHGHAAFYVDVP
jgi:hypothetical protein